MKPVQQVAYAQQISTATPAPTCLEQSRQGTNLSRAIETRKQINLTARVYQPESTSIESRSITTLKSVHVIEND